MSDQDELRDRIAEVIDVHDEQFFDGDYKTTLAQAIIDSLGLTVEKSVIQDALVDFGERAMKMQLDQLRTDEAVERVAEAIYLSHDRSSFFTAKPWAEMVKSKDRANKFRVKQDRKAARAAITALLGEEA